MKKRWLILSPNISVTVVTFTEILPDNLQTSVKKINRIKKTKKSKKTKKETLKQSKQVFIMITKSLV